MTLSTPSTSSTSPTTSPPGRARRIALLAVLSSLTALVTVVLPAQSAHAANYQYWGYYQLTNGAWSFSQNGPDKTTPADGATEGWRWAVADDTGANPRTPRANPAFDAVCGAVAAESGKKRVAVVIDFGRAVDGDAATAPPQPTAACALVATAATGAEVLASVSSVRSDASGLVCGIDNYPATGCGGQVATLTDAQKAADTPVTIAPAVTPQPSPATSTAGTSPSAGQTVAPVIVGAPTSSPSSGVPAVVWVGLVILVLGIAALVWSTYRRRQTRV